MTDPVEVGDVSFVAVALADLLTTRDGDAVAVLSPRTPFWWATLALK